MMWMIYLVGTIDNIANVVIGIAFAFLGVGFLIVMFNIFIIATVDEEKYSFQCLPEETKNAMRAQEKLSSKRASTSLIIFPIISAFFFIIGNLLPSSQTLAAMYLLPKLAQNQQLQQIPDKALTLLNDKLDEWIKQAQANDK